MELNNFTKKLLRNFFNEFEGVEPEEADPLIYVMVLKFFIRNKTITGLNEDLKITLKELYIIDIENPVEFLNY